VVKPKGGNWMTGSVERAVEPMRAAPRPGQTTRQLAEMMPKNEWIGLSDEAGQVSDYVRSLGGGKTEQLSAPDFAMNRWLETKLGKYMRNEMATPEDPIRALAERGVLHVDPQQIGLNRYLASDLRRKSGNQAMGESEAAKAWEDASDVTIGKMPAGELLRQGYAEQMPWLAKVPPETPVYLPSQSDAASNLGFTHLADELRNAVNPASGLPENLLWKYQDLEKVTVPQAVERVAKINDWRAAQKAESDMARSMGPATQLVKEYPEQGFKWVELRQPKETGKKTQVKRPVEDEMPEMNADEAREIGEDMAYGAGHEEGTPEFNNYVREFMESVMARKEIDVDESYKALDDALKYEGETMGHCVGGYCPDVVEGRSKIYSLRDKKGQPHVTIEVRPGRKLTEKDLPDDVREMLSEQYADASREEFEAAVQQYVKQQAVPDEIVQIKGKANRAPNAEYLPAVQDFVRSGNWGRIGDLQNTGLVKFGDEYRLPSEFLYRTDEGEWLNLQDAAKQYFPDSPTKQTNFINGAMMDPQSIKPISKEEGFSRGGQVHGYQAGGAVKAAKSAAKNIGELVEKYTPEFKQWFAGSKAATPEGEPLTVYRGTTKDEGDIIKKGWFTKDPNVASMFSSKTTRVENIPNSVVTPAHLKMKRPLVIEANGAPWDRVPFGDPRDNMFMSSDKIADFARDEKYDGVIFKNIDESDDFFDLEPTDVYVIFEPNQAKSIFNKKPTPDPRVGYAAGGQVSGANFPTDDFDPARIDAIVGELHAMNAA
jgi:hypothetical protein